jgi:hypothetical protein
MDGSQVENQINFSRKERHGDGLSEIMLDEHSPAGLQSNLELIGIRKNGWRLEINQENGLCEIEPQQMLRQMRPYKACATKKNHRFHLVKKLLARNPAGKSEAIDQEW